MELSRLEFVEPISYTAVDEKTEYGKRYSPSLSRIRALLRLASLAGYTLAKMGQVMSRGLAKGNSDHDIARFTGQWCRGLCRIMNIAIDRRGEIPAQGVLLVSNHRSYVDIAVIGSHLPCTFLAKRELKSWPVLGWAATTARTVYVSRDSASSRRESREAVGRKLSAGISFVVFPEGTTAASGLLPFKPGIFKTAADGGFPVVPVAIEYDDRDASWIGDDTFIDHFMRTFGRHKTAVRITFGEPISGINENSLLVRSREQIQEALNTGGGIVLSAANQ